MNETASEVVDSVVEVTSNVTGVFADLYDKIFDWGSQLGVNLISAIVVFIIGWYVIKGVLKLALRAMEKSKMGKELYTFFLSVIRILLIVMLAITCAGMLKINISSFLTALGAAGLAVGLALQSSLTNLAGGVFILITKPFVSGDFVDIGGISGTICEIQLVHTIILTGDNKKVFIPNGDISSSKIINYSAEKERRLDLNFSISAAEDFAHAEKVLMDTVLAHPLCLKSPAPLIRVNSYAGAAAVLDCKVWVKTADYWDLYYDLMEQCKKALDNAGVAGPMAITNVNMLAK